MNCIHSAQLTVVLCTLNSEVIVIDKASSSVAATISIRIFYLARNTTIKCVLESCDSIAVYPNLEQVAVMEVKPSSAASRKPKTVFSLDTPYPDVQW